MRLGSTSEIYDKWEDENNIPFSTKFDEWPPLDEMSDEIDLNGMTLFEQIALKELDEIRKLLKEKK